MELQVGVKALLLDGNGSVLLLLRSKKYETAEGTWDIPGGRIDKGTTLAENLAREVREETGLALTGTPTLLAAQDIMFQNAAGEEKHIVRLTYAATAEGEPTLDGAEHTEFRWVPLSELAALPGLDPYLKQLVDEGRITSACWN